MELTRHISFIWDFSEHEVAPVVWTAFPLR